MPQMPKRDINTPGQAAFLAKNIFFLVARKTV